MVSARLSRRPPGNCNSATAGMSLDPDDSRLGSHFQRICTPRNKYAFDRQSENRREGVNRAEYLWIRLEPDSCPASVADGSAVHDACDGLAPDITLSPELAVSHNFDLQEL